MGGTIDAQARSRLPEQSNRKKTIWISKILLLLRNPRLSRWSGRRTLQLLRQDCKLSRRQFNPNPFNHQPRVNPDKGREVKSLTAVPVESTERNLQQVSRLIG
jgi:hypothetical protein